MKTNDLEISTSEQLPTMVRPEPTNIMQVIARAASDPSVDVSKMERLYAMLEKENARISEQKFNQAMARAQAKMPMIVKDARNPQTGSMYAKLESLCISAAPIIEAESFSLQFSEGDCPNPAKIRVMCKVSHSDGHSETFHVDLSPDDTGAKGNASKTKIHGEGSTFSYGRRYLTTMIFNLTVIGEDDDGTRGRRPKPSGPSTLAAEPTVKELATELWNLLKPIVSKTEGWNSKAWDGHNQWLWREEILDGGIPESAPHLTPKRFREVIDEAKKKI